MQPDSVLKFVARRQQGRETDQPASAQHLKLPIPRATLHQIASLGKTDPKSFESAPKDAPDDEVGRPFVNRSPRRPNQELASRGDVFDTDAEDLDESLTTSLMDATFLRQSSEGGPPSVPAVPDGRAMFECERTQRVHQILRTLDKPGIQSREADIEAYTNSSSEGESKQASNVSYSSDHEPQNGLSQMLRSSSLPGPAATFAKIRPVPNQYGKKILQSDGVAKKTIEQVDAGALGDRDARSMVTKRDMATPDQKHQMSLKSSSRSGKYQSDPPAPGGYSPVQDGPSVHEICSNGQASSVSSPACPTSGEPAGQEDRVSGHNLAADRASLQTSRSGSSWQAELFKIQQTKVQPYGKHSRELDYTWDELSRMNYTRLKGESFDIIPGLVARPIELLSSAGLVDSLKQILSHQRHDQEGTKGRAFFATLSIDQYEECGDLIIEGFKDTLGKFKDARRQKRLLARKFEEKVQQRQYIVATKQIAIEKDLKTMRHNGSGLIPRSHSKKLDQG